MNKLLLVVLYILFTSSIGIQAQATHTGIVTEKPAPKFKKHFAVGSAFSYSVINNRKEIRGQYKPGLNFNADFYTHSWFFWSGEYSYFFKHNSSPGFENINSWNTELNGNLLMGVTTSSLKFRFIFGMNYLNWKGTYVGPDVVDDKTWYIGKEIDQQWVGFNLGFGLMYPLGNHITSYADFRMRFASEKRDLISISDTSFNVGFQFNPFSSVENSTKSKNAHPSHIYKWLKKRVG
ncbi:hypothetical protein BH09BAC5_BH09BAC5_08980 [soil metagenome]